MGLFSALLGNAGAVSQDELTAKYGQLLTDTEVIEMGFVLAAYLIGQDLQPFAVLDWPMHDR